MTRELLKQSGASEDLKVALPVIPLDINAEK